MPVIGTTQAGTGSRWRLGRGVPQTLQLHSTAKRHRWDLQEGLSWEFSDVAYRRILYFSAAGTWHTTTFPAKESDACTHASRADHTAATTESSWSSMARTHASGASFGSTFLPVAASTCNAAGAMGFESNWGGAPRRSHPPAAYLLLAELQERCRGDRGGAPQVDAGVRATREDELVVTRVERDARDPVRVAVEDLDGGCGFAHVPHLDPEVVTARGEVPRLVGIVRQRANAAACGDCVRDAPRPLPSPQVPAQDG